MRMRSPDKSLSLDQLRSIVEKHKEEGRKIITEMRQLSSHFEKMQEYYSDWEDRLNEIEQAISVAEKEHGIKKEEVTEYNMLDDALEGVLQ